MKIGGAGYAVCQGIGYLPKRFYDAGLITDFMIFRHGSRPTERDWYPPGTIELVGRPFNGPAVDAFLAGVDVMLFWETPHDWEFIKYCRDRRVKTVIVSMYECTPVKRPHEPDLWICPSLLDCEYFPGSPYVPIPVETPDWRLRTTARTFLHNAGNLGLRGHKGTLEILEAWKYVKSDATLYIRAQDREALSRVRCKCAWSVRDKRITIESGQVPHADLFASHDVFIMAEKYNGESLPLKEARAAGMLVVTSNRFPTNTWLPTEPLIPVQSYSRQRIGGSYNVYDEALVTPEAIAETVDRLYGTDIEQYSRDGLEWAKANSWEALKPVWLETIGRVLQ